MQSVSRVYADVLSTKPQSYWDYDDLNIKWNPQEITRYLENGTRQVARKFLGIDLERVVIKVLKLNGRKSKRNFHFEELGRWPNIIAMLDVVREPQLKTPGLIFEHINNIDFRSLYFLLTTI